MFLIYWMYNEEGEPEKAGGKDKHATVSRTNFLVFSLIVTSFFLFTMMKTLCFLASAQRISRNIHSKMLRRVLRISPAELTSELMVRILTYFSIDISVLDMQQVPQFVRMHYHFCLLVLFSLATFTALPYNFVHAFVVLFLSFFVREWTTKAQNEAVRLSTACLNKVKQRFYAAEEGLLVIRAQNRTQYFIEQLSDEVDQHMAA